MISHQDPCADESKRSSTRSCHTPPVGSSERRRVESRRAIGAAALFGLGAGEPVQAAIGREEEDLL